MPRFTLPALGLALVSLSAAAEGLGPAVLGVVYNRSVKSSERIAMYYAGARHVPPNNVVGLALPDRPNIGRDEFNALRNEMLRKLPSSVQSLLLIWSRPYAVECMSVTTAMAVGYQPNYCEPGCRRTALSPLYDSQGWLPADTVGWLPAMLLPSDDEALARALVDRGIAADGTNPSGTVYLVRTQDAARNVRAAGYADTEQLVDTRVSIRELATPIDKPIVNIIAYFTGVPRVEELSMLHFRPGAAADHLTSTGGDLDRSAQMSALEWLRRGATGSYGTVSEPCSHPGKFPSPEVFLDHYLRGETLLESYWKSVAMPGQGLFLGEPLARPFTPRP